MTSPCKMTFGDLEDNRRLVKLPDRKQAEELSELYGQKEKERNLQMSNVFQPKYQRHFLRGALESLGVSLRYLRKISEHLSTPEWYFCNFFNSKIDHKWY